jgi:hypothetical protein
MNRRQVVLRLAHAFLAEEGWTADELAVRGAACFERWPRWMDLLALEIESLRRRPDRAELIALIDAFLAPLGQDWIPALAWDVKDAPAAVLYHVWPIAPLASVAELAERLELSEGQLAWLADVRGMERTVTAERLRNYRYRTLARRGGLPRVIEIPKARLKEVQRWILHAILDEIPAHRAAHGFVRGRSVAGHAASHSGRAVVLRLDLKDFFASVSAGRVYGIFRTVGYPPAVAHALTGPTTNALPPSVWATVEPLDPAVDPRLVQARFWLGRQLATPHLPQGAPTSPALANLAAFRLDRRLGGLARRLGFSYSRYADDLVFSSRRPVRRDLAALQSGAASVVADEGFRLNPAKTMVRSAAARQSVCGVVVNVHPNVVRTEYEALKAILWNCARHGAATQNRSGHPDFQAHLRGRIACVASLNPARGAKLVRRFAEIDWD